MSGSPESSHSYSRSGGRAVITSEVEEILQNLWDLSTSYMEETFMEYNDQIWRGQTHRRYQDHVEGLANDRKIYEGRAVCDGSNNSLTDVDNGVKNVRVQFKLNARVDFYEVELGCSPHGMFFRPYYYPGWGTTKRELLGWIPKELRRD